MLLVKKFKKNLKSPKKHTKAQSLLTQALQIREKTLGPNHPEVVKILKTLASSCSENGNTKKANELKRRIDQIK